VEKFSIAFPTHLQFENKYIPLLLKHNNNLVFAYSFSSKIDANFRTTLKNKVLFFKLPLLSSHKVFLKTIKFLNLPDYYSYIFKVILFDILIANKISKDSSKVVFTSPLLINTIKKCKKLGKTVILEAGNSEPIREYNLITSHYRKFNIKSNYIYGDKFYWKTVFQSLQLSDYNITLSKQSHNIYIKSGLYNNEKFKCIQLNGTHFLKDPNRVEFKRKAFISTAFHNFIKGTHLLLLAWKKSNIKNIPLIILGRLSDDIKEFINKYGPFENVVFEGYSNNVESFYYNYDAVGILLSLSEGAGRVVPEMLAFGFPMIVTLDASCDLIVDNYNGFIVDVNNLSEIENKLKYFANDWNNVKLFNSNAINSQSHRNLADFSTDLGNFIVSKL